jgi:hypothetical protein
VDEGTTIDDLDLPDGESIPIDMTDATRPLLQPVLGRPFACRTLFLVETRPREKAGSRFNGQNGAAFPETPDSFRTGSPPVLFPLPPQPVHPFFVPAFEPVEDDDRF